MSSRISDHATIRRQPSTDIKILKQSKYFFFIHKLLNKIMLKNVFYAMTLSNTMKNSERRQKKLLKKTSIIYKIEDRLGELKTGRMELGLCLYMLSCYTPDGGTHGMIANTKT